jgi:hypothetical protein
MDRRVGRISNRRREREEEYATEFGTRMESRDLFIPTLFTFHYLNDFEIS